MNAELLARNVAAHWAQSGLLVGAVLLAMRSVRPLNPRARLTALHLTLAVALLLPVMQRRHTIDSSTQTVVVDLSVPALRTGTNAVAALRSPRVDPSGAALVVLFAGIALRMIWLCGGIVRLARFRRRAREIPAPDVARDIEAMLGAAPRYFEHREPASPAAFGVFGAAVVLPPTFSSLDASMQQAIICHELLHVKRRDALAAVVEELCVAFLWFHPWIWLLRSRIRIEREHVVDQQVVNYLGDRAGYVRCLVKMSGHDLAPHLSAGMLVARELRARISALLEEVPMSRNYSAARIMALAIVAAGAVWLGGWAVPLRAQTTIVGPPDKSFHVAVPADRFRSSLRQSTENASLRRPVKVPVLEYPEEVLAQGIGGIVFVDLAINASGDVTTAAVVTGPEELRVAAFKAAMGLKFEPRFETTAMRISVEYRSRSDSTGVSISWWDAASRHAAFSSYRSNRGAAAVVSEQNSVRRDVRPPRKVKDVL
ncbi:MAG: hypothetical protein EHM55_15725, partial [Acidobacteria bacterium]